MDHDLPSGSEDRAVYRFPNGMTTPIELSARITSALPKLRRALLFENGFRAKLRRGIFNPAIVPPRDAGGEALSRSISALRASWSNALFMRLSEFLGRANEIVVERPHRSSHERHNYSID